MAGVVLESVSRVFAGGVLAVDRVSLEVQDREFLVLVGPSGCGKTTALRLIAGLEELSSGTIKIGGRTVNDVPPKDRDIAMVFQNYALYPHMTVYRNLAFGLELREGVSSWGWLWRWVLPAGRKAQLAARRFDLARRVHESARTLSIEDLLERLPRQLSGGQRQRVALGRAIVRSPEVFLFDEPLSNLDAKLRVDMRRELKQLHRRLQTTMIYVTHDQVEALTLGERIVVMNEGKIQQVGKPMEVYDWPINRFVAGFIGTPAMNFIQGELTSDQGSQSDQGSRGDEGTLGDQGSQRFRRGGWSVSFAERRLTNGRQVGGSVELGVRPEDMRIEFGKHKPPGSIDATVRLVEHMGDATLATLELNDDSSETSSRRNDGEPTFVLSKVDSRTDLRDGQQVTAVIDPSRVHVFDVQTGENLVRRHNAE